MKSSASGIRPNLGSNPGSAFTSCVTLGKSPHGSGPQSFLCKRRLIRRSGRHPVQAGPIHTYKPHSGLAVTDVYKGLPQRLSGKESPCNAGAAGDGGSIPGSGGFPGERHGNSLQYPCLGNPMDRGAWRATVCGVAKSPNTMEASWHTCPHKVYKSLWTGMAQSKILTWVFPFY